MDSIKKFFQKKKAEFKLNKLGPGHHLNEPSARASSTTNWEPRPEPKCAPSDASRRAVEAARERQMQPRPGTGKKTAFMSQVDAERINRRLHDLSAVEQRLAKQHLLEQQQQPSLPPKYSVEGALFTCATIHADLRLPFKDMKAAIRQFLLQQYEESSSREDRVSLAALMLHTFNSSSAVFEKLQACIDMITRYLNNIVNNPDDQKFRRIRVGNTAFQERVASLDGAVQFLQACGFREINDLGTDSCAEKFLVMDDIESRSETIKDSLQLHDTQSSPAERRFDYLLEFIDLLSMAEPMLPQLDRDIKVYAPSERAGQFQLPNEFFGISPEELKREQQARSEALEKMGMLMTKEMRERDKQRQQRRYVYALMRVRLPDGVIVQATFYANEKVDALMQCVRQCLAGPVADIVPFDLFTAAPAAQPSNSSTRSLSAVLDQSFTEAGLAPAALVHFAWDRQIYHEFLQQDELACPYILQHELMDKLQPLP